MNPSGGGMRRMLAGLTRLTHRVPTAAMAVVAIAVGAAGLPAASASPAYPGDARNCSDFTSYNAAWVWYETYKPSFGDVAHLDSDGNGYPCEGLPNPPLDTLP